MEQHGQKESQHCAMNKSNTVSVTAVAVEIK